MYLGSFSKVVFGFIDLSLNQCNISKFFEIVSTDLTGFSDGIV